MGDGDMVLKRAHTDFGDYEEDVIAEILARLPVKSLMRFRCVCKSWRALISESYFVKKHLSYGERGITESTPRFIFMLDPPLSLDFEALMKDDDCDGAAGGGQSAVTQLDFPVPKTIPDYGWRVVIGSCNGLVCLEVPPEAIMLWNPGTRDSKVLPKPPCVINSGFNYHFFGFGYDSASDDYKVIRGFTNDLAKKIMIHIFSLKTGTWRDLKDIDYVTFKTWQGLFLNGALHWLYNLPEGGSRILAFDLEAEKFHKTIPLPCDYWSYDPLIHKNCLCVAAPTGTDSFNIWMMKEYGVKESWTEVVQFSVENYAEDYYEFRSYCTPVCILENGVVLNDKMGKYEHLLVVLSNLKEKTFKHVVEVANSMEFMTVIYRETLVSPDIHTYKTNIVS